MIEYYDADKVKPGMLLRATGFRGEAGNITLGDDYKVVEVVEGIFSNRPYVVVRTDDGSTSMWHLSRFSFIEGSL
jgi:hypothetical protein